MNGIQAVIGLTGFETDVGGMKLSAERFIRLQLPETITAEHVALMQKDLEALSCLARDYPDQVAALQNAAARNDFGTAARVANEIGMNEEGLRRAGGAQTGVAVAVLAVLVIYALATSGGEGGGEPEPVGPNPGNGDAGPGPSDAGLPGGVPDGGGSG